jgi:phosphoribosyl-ATP pyrophosphohydrolase
MNIKELNSVINEALEQETKKLIQEQISDTDHMIDSIKSFQTLSGLIDKISDIEDIGNGDFGIIININGVSPEELVDCCGGESLGESQKNLMQGLHHDLEDNKIGNNFDIDIDTQGDENALNLKIKITTNKDELSGDNEMKEMTKDTNPTIDKKKNVILGGNEKEEPMEGDGLHKVAKTAGKAAKGLVKANLKYNPFTAGAAEAGRRILGKPESPSASPLQKSISKGLDRLGNKIKEEAEKRVVTLSEVQMIELLRKIIKEAAETMDATTQGARIDSAKQNADALAAVEKKIKDYLSFKGNDNPKFPNQIGMGDEKAARQNSKDQDQEMDDNRGRGPQDLDYDTDGVDDNGEPAKKFRDRAKKALVGDSTMGNSPDAGNAIKTDVGEKIAKNAERRRENLRKEPIYPKEAVPVKTKPEKEPLRPVNEEKENPLLKEEMERMKQMVSYNKKTQ